MHILLDTSEINKLNVKSLPDDTTLVESKEDVLVKAYIVNGGKLKITRDFIEESRDWHKGEKKKFIKGKGRDDVLDYFLKHDDNTPQREYSAMSDLEQKVLPFIHHTGTYSTLDDGTICNYFQISIDRGSNLDDAEEEISWALNKIANYYKDVNPIKLEVFEHTCSKNGYYEVLWNRKDKFKLTNTTYGHTEIIKKFNSLRSLIEYISANHYYE